MSRLWPTKKLGEVCDLVKGTEPGSNAYIKKENDTIQFIRVGDLTGKVDNPKFISKELKDLTIISPDEILISFDGTPGIVAKRWAGAISSGIRVIRNIKPEILRDFLFYYLQTPEVRQVIKFYTMGVTILHASRSIPHIEIPLPSLPIQQKIVEQLDIIKETQELNEKQIKLAEELFQSLLNKELRPREGWKVKKLEDVCKKVKRGHPSKIFKIQFRYIDISSIDPEQKTIKGTSFINIEKAPSRARKLVEAKDVLFATTRPYLERIAYVPEELDSSVASTGFCVIRADINFVLPEFLYFIILTKKFISRVLVFQRGASYPAVSDGNIYNIKVALPPLETQRKIVEKLSAVQNYKKKLLGQKQKLQELFDSTLHKAFKGGLIK